MTTIKAVIGANYGDEGKGKMVDYFTSKTKGNTIVVCSNGGSQRGHTVITPNGEEHIFQHFGSGTFNGAATYLPEQFIVNPIIFRKEREKIKKYHPKVFINANCLCSTPFDMMLNQMIEEQRDKKHGSCGMGIWETILRNQKSSLTITDMFDILRCNSKEKIYKLLKNIRNIYGNHRLFNKNMEVLPEWRKIYYSDRIVQNYILDLNYMMQHIQLFDDNVLRAYKNIIFENGQGLLLDQDIKDSEHSTPSNTGSKNIKQILQHASINDPIEVCYVTRSYLTRHGEGDISYQCNSEKLNLKLETEKNKWNKNQGILRYGILDFKELLKRTQQDFITYWKDSSENRMSIAMTHIDECICDKSFQKYIKYNSFGVDRNCVIEY